MTMISNRIQPDFKKCLEKANMILLSSREISGFPFLVKKVVKGSSNIPCKTYLKAGMYGVDMKCFGSNDAIIMDFNNGNKIIFYNESISSKSRIRFSIAHEFGHDQMHHKLNDSSNYQIQEIEANFFAAQLLMPEQVINELRRRGMQITQEYLQRWFVVSKSAAKKRIETLRKVDYTHRTDEEKEMDNYIVSKFQDFINKIAPISNSFLAYDTYDEEKMQNERDHWY